MATLAALVDGVYRDLADEGDPHVFSTLQVEDFVRGGISELNRVCPNDTVYDLPVAIDPDTGLVTSYSYDTPIELPYLVELVRLTDGWSEVIPDAEPGQTVSTGYTFRATPTGGTFDFPQWWLANFDQNVWAIRIHGYAARPLPYTVDLQPSPEVPLSEQEEYSVRAYAKSEAFDLLSHDRSMFAQWQGQTNNTDVSPTQMMQLAASAKQAWDRQRGLIRVVRKYW